jgi:hypothetical protein
MWDNPMMWVNQRMEVGHLGLPLIETYPKQQKQQFTCFRRRREVVHVLVTPKVVHLLTMGTINDLLTLFNLKP